MCGGHDQILQIQDVSINLPGGWLTDTCTDSSRCDGMSSQSRPEVILVYNAATGGVDKDGCRLRGFEMSKCNEVFGRGKERNVEREDINFWQHVFYRVRLCGTAFHGPGPSLGT